MQLVGAVCDEWSAHLMDRLIARSAPIETVLVANRVAHRLWQNRPSSSRVAVVDQLTSDYDRVINVRPEKVAVDIPQITAAVWCPDGLGRVYELRKPPVESVVSQRIAIGGFCVEPIRARGSDR